MGTTAERGTVANEGSNQPGSASQLLENGSLETELTQLRAAYARLLERQARIMELIGSKDAEHLVHDIRGVLNERELLRALADV
jgi:hypothetical protein